MSSKLMLPIPQIWLQELITRQPSQRVTEPTDVMTSKAQAEAYRQAGLEGGAFCGNHLFILEQLTKRIQPGDTVLDLCCGTGDVLVKVAELCPDAIFVGVDLSEEMLAHAKRSIEVKRLKNIVLMVGDVTNLNKIKSRSFDFVSSTMALHHLKTQNDLNKCFSEVTRILKNTGGVFLYDFVHIRNEHNMRVIVDHIAGSEAQIFQDDFFNSLKAAFSVNDFKSAYTVLSQNILQTPAQLKVSTMPLVMSIATPARTKPSPLKTKELKEYYAKIPLNQKLNYWATRLFLWM